MADIVLKDRNGNDVTYEGIETVTFDTPTEGEQVVFTEGVKVEGIEIGLDMSNGDQSIIAPDGTLVKSAIIKKPETMKPENIRNGVEIGCILGSFIGDTEETTLDLNFRSASTYEEILEELTFTSVISDTYGYCYQPEGQFSLIVGDTYRVVWGEDEYSCVAMDGDAMLSGMVFIGDATVFGLSGNGEPFAIGVVDNSLLIVCLDDIEAAEATEHNIAIYRVIEGELADMEISPSANGKVLSKVTVKKPETLVPENVAKDVAIGGIVGTFEGGDGGLHEVMTRTVSKVVAPEVSQIYPHFFQDCSYLSIAEFPDCTSIGFSAFQDCTSLMQVDIGTCNTIPSWAFKNCYSLSQINNNIWTSIGEGGFLKCSSLSEINLTECTSIGSWAFQGCSSLTQVNAPNCTFVGSYAFSDCTELTDVVLKTENGPLPTGLFKNAKKLSNIMISGCNSLPISAFSNYTTLKSAVFPDVSIIGASAFSGCTNLTTVGLSLISYVPAHAFRRCTKLSSIHLPACSSVGSYGFANCTALTELTDEMFPSLSYTGSSAFYSCTSLSTVSLTKLKNVYSYAFCECTHLTHVDLPSCTSIYAAGFYSCYLLSSVSLPLVSQVGMSAFYNCSSLKKLYLPACKGITQNAFYNCYGLSMLVLPAVSKLYSRMFNFTISRLYLLPSTVVTAQDIYACQSVGTFYVPEALLDSYKTATYFSTYSSKFVGMTDEEIQALYASFEEPNAEE